MRYGPNTAAIEAFLDRLAALPFSALGEVLTRWRAQMADGRAGEWFAAEDALGDAVTLTERHDLQQALLEAIYDVFRRRPWFTAQAPSSQIPGADGSAQYLVTDAVLALLVRDQLAPHTFNTLYAPFAEWIPLAALPAPTRHEARRVADEARTRTRPG
jgi:hypothetical protein